MTLKPDPAILVSDVPMYAPTSPSLRCHATETLLSFQFWIFKWMRSISFLSIRDRRTSLIDLTEAYSASACLAGVPRPAGQKWWLQLDEDQFLRLCRSHGIIAAGYRCGFRTAVACKQADVAVFQRSLPHTHRLCLVRRLSLAACSELGKCAEQILCFKASVTSYFRFLYS